MAKGKKGGWKVGCRKLKGGGLKHVMPLVKPQRDPGKASSAWKRAVSCHTPVTSQYILKSQRRPSDMSFSLNHNVEQMALLHRVRESFSACRNRVNLHPDSTVNLRLTHCDGHIGSEHSAHESAVRGSNVAHQSHLAFDLFL